MDTYIYNYTLYLLVLWTKIKLQLDHQKWRVFNGFLFCIISDKSQFDSGLLLAVMEVLCGDSWTYFAYQLENRSVLNKQDYTAAKHSLYDSSSNIEFL